MRHADSYKQVLESMQQMFTLKQDGLSLETEVCTPETIRSFANLCPGLLQGLDNLKYSPEKVLNGQIHDNTKLDDMREKLNEMLNCLQYIKTESDSRSIREDGKFDNPILRYRKIFYSLRNLIRQILEIDSYVYLFFTSEKEIHKLFSAQPEENFQKPKTEKSKEKKPLGNLTETNARLREKCVGLERETERLKSENNALKRCQKQLEETHSMVCTEKQQEERKLQEQIKTLQSQLSTLRDKLKYSTKLVLFYHIFLM